MYTKAGVIYVDSPGYGGVYMYKQIPLYTDYRVVLSV